MRRSRGYAPHRSDVHRHEVANVLRGVKHKFSIFDRESPVARVCPPVPGQLRTKPCTAEADIRQLLQVRGSLARSSAGRLETSYMSNRERMRGPCEENKGAEGYSGIIYSVRGRCGKAIAVRCRTSSIVGCAIVASTRPAVRMSSDSVTGGRCT